MTTSFSKDIRGLFRQGDRETMLKTRHKLDLWDYAQVSNWADRILVQLEAGSMPCDGAWPSENIAILKKWIADGKPP
jgi:hypothetical protein